MWSLFDRDNSGTISANELGVVLSKLFKWRPTRYESEKIIATVAAPGSNSINFREFVLMMTRNRDNFTSLSSMLNLTASFL